MFVTQLVFGFLRKDHLPPLLATLKRFPCKLIYLFFGIEIVIKKLIFGLLLSAGILVLLYVQHLL